MTVTDHKMIELLAQAPTRLALWTQFLQMNKVQTVAELGVYQGEYAETVLAECPSIETYYMIDPWRHLDDWEKPMNDSDKKFEGFLTQTKARTEFAAEKRVILRGKTTEVIDEIDNGTLDFCYVDGDHTLKGVTIDLVRVWPKIREGGWVGGDDFATSIWQHRTDFEPTMVFPFAVYFAEAINAPIYALPFEQFLIEKDRSKPFSFIDLTGSYGDVMIKDHLAVNQMVMRKVQEIPARLKKVAKQVKGRLAGG